MWSDTGGSASTPAASASWRSSLAAFSPARLLGDDGPPEPDLFEQERNRSKLLQTIRDDGRLSSLLLSAVAEGAPEQHELVLLLPQNVTLSDVTITQELVETHVVHLQRASRGQPRVFTSLNGLSGTLQPDNTVAVHGRLRRAMGGDGLGSSAGHWRQERSRGTIPQLESAIYVLREGLLQARICRPLQGLHLARPRPLLDLPCHTAQLPHLGSLTAQHALSCSNPPTISSPFHTDTPSIPSLPRHALYRPPRNCHSRRASACCFSLTRFFFPGAAGNCRSLSASVRTASVMSIWPSCLSPTFHSCSSNIRS